MFIATVIPLLILLCDEFLPRMNLGDTTESLFRSRFFPHADYSQLLLSLSLSFINTKILSHSSTTKPSCKRAKVNIWLEKRGARATVTQQPLVILRQWTRRTKRRTGWGRRGFSWAFRQAGHHPITPMLQILRSSDKLSLSLSLSISLCNVSLCYDNSPAPHDAPTRWSSVILLEHIITHQKKGSSLSNTLAATW